MIHERLPGDSYMSFRDKMRTAISLRRGLPTPEAYASYSHTLRGMADVGAYRIRQAAREAVGLNITPKEVKTAAEAFGNTSTSIESENKLQMIKFGMKGFSFVMPFMTRIIRDTTSLASRNIVSTGARFVSLGALDVWGFIGSVGAAYTVGSAFGLPGIFAVTLGLATFGVGRFLVNFSANFLYDAVKRS